MVPLYVLGLCVPITGMFFVDAVPWKPKTRWLYEALSWFCLAGVTCEFVLTVLILGGLWAWFWPTGSEAKTLNGLKKRWVRWMEWGDRSKFE